MHAFTRSWAYSKCPSSNTCILFRTVFSHKSLHSKVHKYKLNWKTYVRLPDSIAKAVRNKNSIMNRRTSLARAVQMMRAWPSFHHFCTASTWMNWTSSSSLIHWIIRLSGLHGNQIEKEIRVAHGNPPRNAKWPFDWRKKHRRRHSPECRCPSWWRNQEISTFQFARQE